VRRGRFVVDAQRPAFLKLRTSIDVEERDKQADAAGRLVQTRSGRQRRRPKRFDRVVFFRRRPSIRYSYVTLYTIAAWIAEGAAAPGQRVHARHTPKADRRRYRVRPGRRRVLDGRRGDAAREGPPLVNRDGRAARRRR